MKLVYNQLVKLNGVLKEIENNSMPFKLSLIVAKNLATIAPEVQFFVAKEMEFAQNYLEFNENGLPVETSPGVYKIKSGMLKECQEARAELDNFEVDVNLRMIPISLIENMNFTPAQLAAMEFLIEEE